ncbi:hypothetical protein T484DRAFT_1987422 [Baffinella frigidus]|nr:hypothetical protein T484DRAFT_1987422 [Cryptophyta sp. CCMP2293]
MHHIFLMHFLCSSLFLASSFKPEFAPYIRFALSKAMAATSVEPLELSSKNLDALKDLVLAPKPSASLLKALSLPTARTGLPALADASHGGAHTRVVDEGAAGKRQRSWEGEGADAPQLQRIELRVARGRGGERRSEADGDGLSAQELRRSSRARDPDIDYNLDTADGLGRQRDPSGGGLRVVFEGRSVLAGLARFLACGVLVDPPEEVAVVLRDGTLPTDVVTVRPAS